METQVDSSLVTGVECSECGEIFLPYEAPQGRLPEHKPSYDQSRELPCSKSNEIGIEVTAAVPIRRDTILSLIN